MKRYKIEEILSELEKRAQPSYVETIKSYGVPSDNILGIKNPILRKLATRIGKDHELAIQLWATGLFEGRLLASYLADPDVLDWQTAEKWAHEIDSWPICDSICNVFARMDGAYSMAVSWTSRDEEFVKRAGFVIIVNLAVHDKRAPDERIEIFLPYIRREAWDERKYVKKGVNWALRQIGKRSFYLNKKAISVALEIKNQGTRPAIWIATDALRELTSKAVIDRLHHKARNVSSDR